MSKNKKYNKYNKNNKNELITSEQSVDKEAKDIFNKIVSLEQPHQDDLNPDELINLFNQNQSKKTMLRILKSNALLDKVLEQAIKRFTENPDEFSNQDLLNYMKVVLDSINNSQKTLSTQQEQINKPLIQINQQNINTNDPFKNISQEKVLSVFEEIVKIMSNDDNNIVDGEMVEIVEGDKNE